MASKFGASSPNPVPSAAQAEVQRQMQILRKRYLEKLPDSLAIIDTALALCDTGVLEIEDREMFRQVAHKLAGTGTTYGFAEISKTGRALDDVMKAEPFAAPGGLKALGLELKIACHAALAGTDSGGEAQRDVQTQTGFGRRAPSNPPEVTLKPRQLPIILAADDDDNVLGLFTQLFEGYAEVITARSADEALKLMRLYRPDLVLLDDIMPDSISGLKFLEHIQRTGEFAKTPFLMVTASDAETDIERGLQAGASDYITKPFDPTVVALKVQRILSNWR